MKKKTTLVRQGDVLLLRVEAKASDLEQAPKDPRGIVLAEGETSNHFHSVFGRNVKLCQYKQSGQRVLVVVGDDAEVRVVGGGSGGVARHTPIALSPGKYEIRVQRSWSSEQASRQVQD